MRFAQIVFDVFAVGIRNRLHHREFVRRKVADQNFAVGRIVMHAAGTVAFGERVHIDLKIFQRKVNLVAGLDSGHITAVFTADLFLARFHRIAGHRRFQHLVVFAVFFDRPQQRRILRRDILVAEGGGQIHIKADFFAWFGNFHTANALVGIVVAQLQRKAIDRLKAGHTACLRIISGIRKLKRIVGAKRVAPVDQLHIVFGGSRHLDRSDFHGVPLGVVGSLGIALRPCFHGGSHDITLPLAANFHDKRHGAAAGDRVAVFGGQVAIHGVDAHIGAVHRSGILVQILHPPHRVQIQFQLRIGRQHKLVAHPTALISGYTVFALHIHFYIISNGIIRPDHIIRCRGIVAAIDISLVGMFIKRTGAGDDAAAPDGVLFLLQLQVVDIRLIGYIVAIIGAGGDAFGRRHAIQHGAAQQHTRRRYDRT